MILLVTNARDLTCDYVILELKRRQTSYLRLNTETLGESKVTLRPTAIHDSSIEISGRRLLIGDVKAAYFRRPGLPAAHPGIRNQSERQYVVAEWSALLKSLYLALEGRWLNAPWSIFQAEDKPRQLRLAARLGFMVADTVISNDLDAVWRSGAAPRVGKTLRQALLEDEDGPGRVIFTSELPKLDPLMAESFALAPMIVQTKISKRVDVRVTVVGEHLFATEIHSQSSSETETDWRKGADPNLIHRVHELPEDIKRCCLALTHALDLRFGAIDLVLDTKGVYWFLEINPNGQWAWIESRTGAPITAAIVDCLEAIGLRS